MSFDAGDKESVQKKQKSNRTRRAVEGEFLRGVLSQPAGRAVMWRILSKCGLYRDNPFPDAPGSMARHEGQRSIGLWLLAEIFDADPNAYERMRREAEQGVKDD